MATSRRTSAEGSSRRTSHPSRRSSAASISINVFSDDFAVENVDLPDTTTPSGSIQESVDLTLTPRDNTLHEPTRIPRSGLSATIPSPSRPSSIAKRPQPSDQTSVPHRSVSILSHSDATTQRSGSISSRLSIPRPHSPYTGPTQPSQPYAMYPQVTRASSIASESTIRPLENPFLDPQGPEHPYGMYQNAVPEEEDHTTNEIPLGFSGVGSNFHSGSRSTRSETGDIVGSDGHVEQLPPYTRYADNVLAKGDMREIRTPAPSIREENSSGSMAESSTLAPSDSAIELNPTQTRNDEERAARKEGWIARGNKRRCCGLPMWTLLLICLIIVIAATAGGVIGGLIGNDQGSDKAAALASAASAAAATTTVWLDANPASTNSGTPPCPTGHYIIPLNNTMEVNSCIAPGSGDLAQTWSCMGQADLGMSIFNGGPGGPPTVHFDDYSLRPQLFRYGPQPPDFNGTTFQLSPATDKDAAELGVAMFFSTLFDKLIIIKETDITPPPPAPSNPSKRSINANEIYRRLPQSDGGYPMFEEFLEVGDKPWYCFWNSTVEEFWVYLTQDLRFPAGSQSSATGVMTAAPGATNTASSVTEIGSAAATTGGDWTGGAPAAATSAGWNQKERRDFPATVPSPEFPKLVKMVEKRKPNDNVQPYCQQMQVLNDWQIMPIPTVPTICIDEDPYSQPTPSPGGRKWVNYLERRNGMTQQEMESNCICEWMTGVEDHH